MNLKTQNKTDRSPTLSLNQYFLLVHVALKLHRSHISLVEKRMDGYSDTEFTEMCNATLAGMTRDRRIGSTFRKLPVGYIAALREELPVLENALDTAFWLVKQHERELRA